MSRSASVEKWRGRDSRGARRVDKAREQRRLRPTLEDFDRRVLLSASTIAVNAIVAENALPGTPQSVWSTGNNGNLSIQGFATDISVDQGGSISFKVDNVNLAPYRIDIYRMGYYQGNGARMVATIPSSQVLSQVQPPPLTDYATGLVDAGNWSVSATWAVPAEATSGIYFARFTREDDGGATAAYFVVRDDDGGSDLLFQTSDSTWQAYNFWDGTNSGAGSSLYAYSGPNPDLQARGKAMAVSYNRPLVVDTRGGGLGSYNSPLHAEYPMVRWLESNGYDVSYTTNADTARHGDLILNHKAFLSVGHDEYWSAEQRSSVEAARDAGVNLAFFSGNEIFWKTRWASSIDVSATDYRTVITYKESQVGIPVDPLNAGPTRVSTGTWRDPRFGTPADAGRPENALSGTIYMNDRTNVDLGISMNVPASDAPLRFWRNTSIASLQAGDVATLGQYVVGYEVDEDLDNGFRPAGLITMSSTTFQTTSHVIVPWGSTVGPGTGHHKITLYRAPSGALVFGSGTVQWSWGLDGVNNQLPVTPDPAMQQATVNLLADMNAQPATLRPGLVPATASIDVTPPASAIHSPAAGATGSLGQTLVIVGTATDAGGGVVGGVEVSTDGGLTWHPASGRSEWSYTWVVDTAGPVRILSRAADDSGNLELPSTSVIITVPPEPTSTVGLVAAYGFNEGGGPNVLDASGRGNTGIITNATWTGGVFGHALSFDGAGGWVTVGDANSLDLTSGMTLEAWIRPTAMSGSWASVITKERQDSSSYSLYSGDGTANTPSTGISISNTDFSTSGATSLGLGVWSFLAATYDGSSLKVFVNGTLAASQNVTGLISTSSGALRIGGNAIWGEYFTGLIDEVRIYDRALSAGEIRADMSTPVGGALETSPPTGSITSPQNASIHSGVTDLSVTVSDNVGIAQVQYFLDGARLGMPQATFPYALAWDTRTALNGSHSLSAVVTDLAGNSTVLAARTFAVDNPPDVSAPSIRLINPDSGPLRGTVVPAAVAADNMGVVGVQFKANGTNIGPEVLRAPFRIAWDTRTIPDGTYVVTAVARDAAGNTTTSEAATVTVDNTQPMATSQTPTAGSVGISTSTAIIGATLSEPVRSDSIAVVVEDPSGYVVPGAISYDPVTRSARFVPAGTLEPATTYTITLRDVLDLAGNPVATTSWTFTTTSTVVNATIWGGSATPSTPSANDSTPLELGLKFASKAPGYVTAVRFFKGPANVGTHVGRLWSGSGELMASVTFAQETATGWQTAYFDQPVAIEAWTNYVVSYVAPSGGYAFDGNYFASSGVDSGVLVVAGGADGPGVYGPANTHPTNSFNASNYWVDAVFSNVLLPTVVASSPTALSTGVATTLSELSVKFNKPVLPESVSFALRDAAGGLVPGTLGYDAVTATFRFVPAAPLGPLNGYTATVLGAVDLAGNMQPEPFTWSFTTGPADTTPPVVVRQTPTPGASSVSHESPALSVIAVFSEAVRPETIVFGLRDPGGNLVTTTVTYDTASHSVALTADASLAIGTTYTATLTGAEDLAGNSMGPVSWSFTTGLIVDASFWGGNATPSVASANDTAPYELGVKFRSEVGGYVTGVRFYKGPLNTGTHVAHIWAANDTTQFGACPGCGCGAMCFLRIAGGTLLASATYTDETASGWQEVRFSLPVLIMPNTDYVVSYSAPNGGYAFTPGYFNTATTSGTLHAPSSSAGGGNGLYGPLNALPTQSYNATNYWVDPIFSTSVVDLTAPGVVTTTPAPDSTAASPTTTLKVTFDEEVDPGQVSFTLRDSAGNPVPATVTWNTMLGDGGPLNAVTLSPRDPLGSLQTYTATIQGVRDLAGNVMAVPYSWSFTTAPVVTQAMIWPESPVPAIKAWDDSSAHELGIRFRASLDGYIWGIRFYKGPGNNGTHIGNLWDADGTRLASAVFSNETSGGWQQVSFDTPVPIKAGTMYVASYFAPMGHYAVDPGYFTADGRVAGVLEVPASPTLGGYGVFNVGNASAFPSGSYNGNNYWVDVVYSNTLVDTTSPTLIARSPAPDAVDALTNTPISFRFSEPVQASTVSITLRDPMNNAIGGSLSYDLMSNVGTLTPIEPLAASTTYTVSISGARDLSGNVMAPVSWDFSTMAPITGATLWPGGATPTNLSADDTTSVELGVKFRSDVSGYVTGIRFYKGPGNAGTHVGNLWDADGTRLASAVFSNETSSGWQQVNFATPVAITAGTTYVASYFAPLGRYSYDPGAFAASGVDSGVLHALSDAAAGGNGLYRYGQNGGFPDASFNATNYWVDAVFSTLGDVTSPTLVHRSPGDSATGVGLGSTVTATFSEPVQPSTIAFVLRDSNDNVVDSAVAFDPATGIATLTPVLPLDYSTRYTARISGVQDLAGNVMQASASWTFSTEDAIWLETLASDFAGGGRDGTVVTNASGGEVQLASSISEDFDGPELSAGWLATSWAPAGGGPSSVVQAGGVLAVAGAQVSSATAFAPGALEGRIRFSSTPFQHFGMATDLGVVSGNYWAIFSTAGTSDTLYARVNNGGTMVDVGLGTLPAGYHVYRIQPAGDGIRFLIDGIVQTTVPVVFPGETAVRAMLSSYNGPSSGSLDADWIRLASYAASGTYTSAAIDAGRTAVWGAVSWNSTLPAGTSFVVQTSSSLDGITWDPWADVTNGGTIASPAGRYLRYRILFTTTDPSLTASLSDLTIRWS